MLAVASDRLQDARRAIENHWEQGLDEDQLESLNQDQELSEDEDSCPACGHVFASGTEHCPDCGLRVG